MSACVEACCGTTPRLSVSDLVARGLRRNRAAPLPIQGRCCADAEGLSASFSLELVSGRLARIGFRATSCATLIAYCEYLAESLVSASPQVARALSPADLVAALSGVPKLKQNRASLAVAGLRAALDEIANFAGKPREEAAP